jgi:DNA/RNA-binding domain of Phe-tRNA-synthetase-like protein
MAAVTIELEEHPLLELAAFETVFAAPLGELSTPPELLALLARDAAAPLVRDEARREEVRRMLRHGGYKPTGRGKPASEYLARAADEGRLGSINLAVDACNAVSLHSGFPISVVDADRLRPPLSVTVMRDEASYVFNASGQVIAVKGLLCLSDSEGPCANAVKDSQRSKTDAGTRRTLSLIWGLRSEGATVERASAWYRSLLDAAGAETRAIDLVRVRADPVDSSGP